MLTDRVNWAAMSHRALYEACIQGHEPGAAYARGQEWQELGAEMSAAAADFAERIRGTESEWEGAAADTAREATLSIAGWCAEAGAAAQRIGDSVIEQARAGEAAIARMPEPVEFDFGRALSGLGAGDPAALIGDVQPADERARAAQECAVDVMCALEECCTQIDRAMPECPPAPPDIARGVGDGPGFTASQGTGPPAVGTAPVPGASGAAPEPSGAVPRPTTPTFEPGVVTPAPRTPPPRAARVGFAAGPHADTVGGPPGSGLGGPQPSGDPSTRPIAGPGIHGAPGVSGATSAGGIEHHVPRYFTGETIFDLPPCGPSVIGEWDRSW